MIPTLYYKEYEEGTSVRHIKRMMIQNGHEVLVEQFGSKLAATLNMGVGVMGRERRRKALAEKRIERSIDNDVETDLDGRRAWTLDEKNRLLELRGSGFTIAECGNVLKRSPESIRAQMRTIEKKIIF